MFGVAQHAELRNNINRVLLFVCMFQYSIVAFSQNVELKQIRKELKLYRVPEDHSGSIKEVCTYIQTKFTTDSAKVKAIYNWIALHILYDHAALDSNTINFNHQTASIVFEQKKAVCSGFANLFEAMCNQTKLTCEIIDGYAKSSREKCEGEFDFKKQGHAWNAVKLSNSWYLFDVTWAANSLEHGDSSGLYTYYKASPDLFVKGHYPTDPIWQLKFQPITFSQWCDPKLLDMNKPTKDTLLNYPLLINEYLALAPGVKKAVQLRRAKEFLMASGQRSLVLEEELGNAHFNLGVNEFNDAIDVFNKYITAIHSGTRKSEIKLESWQIWSQKLLVIILQTDTIRKLLQHSYDTVSRNVVLEKVEDFCLKVDREIQCIEHYKNRSTLGKNLNGFYPTNEYFYRNHPYTIKEMKVDPNHIVLGYPYPLNLEDSTEFYMGFNFIIPVTSTFQFRDSKLIMGFGTSMGLRHNDYLHILQFEFLFGNDDPPYSIRYNDITRASNTSAAMLISFQSEKSLLIWKRSETFLTAKVGFSQLNLFYDETIKKVVVSDNSPLIGMGLSSYIRFSHANHLKLSLSYNMLFHQTNAGANLNGGLINLGVSYGLGGNKN